MFKISLLRSGTSPKFTKYVGNDQIKIQSFVLVLEWLLGSVRGIIRGRWPAVLTIISWQSWCSISITSPARETRTICYPGWLFLMTVCRSLGNVSTMVFTWRSSLSITISASGNMSFLASASLFLILSTMSTSSTSAFPGIHKLILASERLSKCNRLSLAETSLWRWLYLFSQVFKK